MKASLLHGWRRRTAVVLGLSALLVACAHPLAGAASDIWGNVGPASQLGSGGLAGRYPLGNYGLDQHFDAISASLTGGVDAGGIAPMIAYFLASVLWALTSFLANALISLFALAFGLDLLNGSGAGDGTGALAPVSQAIHSIYANVFGAPWLVLAVAVVGIWAMWKALVQRRYSETAGALAVSLIYVVLALFFVAQPAATIGGASKWTNKMSVAFLSVAGHGSTSGGREARDGAAQQLFDLLVFKPWVVLNFGGLEHCVLADTGSADADPDSVAVRPLSTDPTRDAALARRLGAGGEVSADGKICANNAEKYAPHFLRFGLGTDERDAEYEALTAGDSSKLPEADTAKAGYRLGVADKPASDAMEEGGQYQRLLIAIVVFVGELGAFCLLGALAVGIVLAQILLLLLLAFAPVALVAAAIPGRGHDFFKGWLEKLAGFLLRKAAYSLILAILLAVNGALASATEQLGWLMSFGLQALFFWVVFLQRKSLAQSLVGIATGAGAPGREGTLRVLALYAGARTVARPLRGLRRAGRATGGPPPRLAGDAEEPRRQGAGGGATQSPVTRPQDDRVVAGADTSSRADLPKSEERRGSAGARESKAEKRAPDGGRNPGAEGGRRGHYADSLQKTDPVQAEKETESPESSLGAELRRERELRKPAASPPDSATSSKAADVPGAPIPDARHRRRWRKGRDR
ncbi:MAG TPA: hypothetical protein VFN18_11875 [Solirubrobacterales bacterium]|nr:hypothetical protein [Solirubrobacterales bacterium]